MVDVHYENPRLVAIYDIDSPWSVDRGFYLELAGADRAKILDLGCGTGLLCDAYAARGHDVTGVDPAAAMLAVARQKRYGRKITWVAALAQDFDSVARFDLIIMTGHAFQVLQTDEDILAVFAVVRKHLAPGGRFVFESRNPALDWAQLWQGRQRLLETGEGEVGQRCEVLWRKGDLLAFEWSFAFADEVLVSKSVLRFLARADIVALLAVAGLRVNRLMGDWDGGPFEENESREMIFDVAAD